MDEQIAREVEELVPRRLVRVDGAACGEDPVAREDDDALGRDVRREPAFREGLDLVREAERPSRRDASAEVVGIAVPARRRRDARVGEVDGGLESDAGRRLETIDALADRDLRAARDDRLRFAARDVEVGDRVAEARGAAVRERNLRAVDDDAHATMEPETRKRCQDVLDGRDANPSVSESRRSVRVDDLEVPERRGFAVLDDFDGTVGALEPDVSPPSAVKALADDHFFSGAGSASLSRTMTFAMSQPMARPAAAHAIHCQVGGEGTRVATPFARPMVASKTGW